MDLQSTLHRFDFPPHVSTPPWPPAKVEPLATDVRQAGVCQQHGESPTTTTTTTPTKPRACAATHVDIVVRVEDGRLCALRRRVCHGGVVPPRFRSGCLAGCTLVRHPTPAVPSWSDGVANTQSSDEPTRTAHTSKWVLQVRVAHWSLSFFFFYGTIVTSPLRIRKTRGCRTSSKSPMV